MEHLCNNPKAPWNKGRLVRQKLPLKLHEVWKIRVRLELVGRTRELALFNLAIASKLRGCDLVALRVQEVVHGDHVLPRTIVIQQKTRRPVQFEITENTRSSIRDLIRADGLQSDDHLFRRRWSSSPHPSTRQYARLLTTWVEAIGLDATMYETHSLRRTKPTLIYRRTKNLRAIQIWFGHEKLESTAR